MNFLYLQKRSLSMNEQQTKRISKFLSLVLRHKPETIKLNLDEQGWAEVDELLEKMSNNRKIMTLDQLQYVVKASPSTTTKQKSAPIKDTPLIFN